MTEDRRQGRILAMKALCQWEVQQDKSTESLDDFLTSQEGAKSVSKYAAALAKRYWDQHVRIDECISAASENWQMSRISSVERNVMRVAVVEFLTEKVPPKAVINEAIEIGREFGGENSPRFINGVLDAILKNSPLVSGDGS
jgi:N utilization substance protein B